MQRRPEDAYWPSIRFVRKRCSNGFEARRGPTNVQRAHRTAHLSLAFAAGFKTIKHPVVALAAICPSKL